MTKMKLWNRRQRGRGVAMVEAGILAPIFAMMMMMTVYLMGTYETKLRTVMMSRYATWSYASNACTDEEFKPITNDLPVAIINGANTGSNGGDATQQQNPSSGDSRTGEAEADGAASAGAKMMIAKGKSTMTWNYKPTYKFNGGTTDSQGTTTGGSAKEITTESQTVCNPKPVGMNILKYIQDVAKNVL